MCRQDRWDTRLDACVQPSSNRIFDIAVVSLLAGWSLFDGGSRRRHSGFDLCAVVYENGTDEDGSNGHGLATVGRAAEQQVSVGNEEEE
jgi:hypothetical protein